MSAHELHTVPCGRRVFLWVAGMLAFGWLMLAATPRLSAATFVVSNTADNGPGSLRDAIAAAQQTPGPNSIEFDRHVRGTIVLTSGEIVITEDLTINGPGAHRLSISGNDADRVFDIEGNIPQGAGITVSISGLRIKHGLATSNSLHGSAGGAIYVTEGAHLVLTGVVLSRSRAVDTVGGTAEGGAIAGVNSGVVTVSDVVVKHNRAVSSAGGAALGGAFFNDSTSSLGFSDSQVTLNEAVGSPGIGGGVYSLGTLTIDSLTIITGNTASTGGNDIGP